MIQTILIAYLCMLWIMTALLMWADWFQEKSYGLSVPKFAILVMILYIIFMPALFLHGLLRK